MSNIQLYAKLARLQSIDCAELKQVNKKLSSQALINAFEENVYTSIEEYTADLEKLKSNLKSA